MELWEQTGISKQGTLGEYSNSGSVRPLMTGGERETESRIQTRIGLIIISTLNINQSK